MTYYEEASVSVQYDGMTTPEEAARALIEWIKGEVGPIYVHVTDEHGQMTPVCVREDQGKVAYRVQPDSISTRNT